MNTESKQRGAFIVLEGCDRSGKTTQCEKIVQVLKLQNIKVEKRQFPNRKTPIGYILDGYLKGSYDIENHALHHLFIANMWEEMNAIEKSLYSGKTVIIDRYFLSTIAFSMAKDTADFKWCHLITVGLPKPDIVIFLDISPDVLSKRMGFGEERYENQCFQKKVANNYKLMKTDNWYIIDASSSIDIITLEIEKIIKATINLVKHYKLDHVIYK